MVLYGMITIVCEEIFSNILLIILIINIFMRISQKDYRAVVLIHTHIPPDDFDFAAA